jgi:predicted aspartyl protease
MRYSCAILALILSLAGAPARGAGPEIEVPFDFLHNQIVLHATINGQGPYNMLLDTGTQVTTIDIGLARSLRLPLGLAVSESTGVGTRRITGRQTVCEELRLGDVAAARLAAIALDLSKVARVMDWRVSGVLGFNFLASRVVRIDYFRRRIVFYEKSPFPPSPLPSTSRRASFAMQFRAHSVLPVLEDCYVNGQRISVTLDTGSSLGLILFPQAIRHLGLEKLAHDGIPLGAAGYKGNARLTKGWVKSVKLKTVDLGASEVAYVERGYGESEDLEQRGGNLGNAVLQDFVLTLDYRGRVVVLEALDQ